MSSHATHKSKKVAKKPTRKPAKKVKKTVRKTSTKRSRFGEVQTPYYKPLFIPQGIGSFGYGRKGMVFPRGMFYDTPNRYRVGEVNMIKYPFSV